jgi:8-oxo-dGTP pyrophosphatase MutT (NUDIX family)
VEKDENDLTAAIRETAEEIGLDLSNSLMLGRLPNNFFAYYKTQK